MRYALDPAIARFAAAMVDQAPGLPMPARGDWQGLRQFVNAMVGQAQDDASRFDQVVIEDVALVAEDGANLSARLYRKNGQRPRSAIVYAHGGGMIASCVAHYESMVAGYVDASDVTFLSVEYRLAPEVQGDAPARDLLAAVRWLIAQAERLDIDPNRIGIMGDSGGGGVAAGAAILARDASIGLARQILIYPMLDDRNVVPDPQLAAFAGWTQDFNFTAWTALLGDARGGEQVPPSAAPARLKRFEDLPPTYLEVGDLDIFRNETIDFARGLAGAGVPLELHVHPGCPHGFDRISAEIAVGQRAYADRVRNIRLV